MTATVVVSCYNQEKYIAECLDSILSQVTSFPFNIVICDDHSTDKTPDILKKYKSAHPTIIEIVLRNQNVGAAYNYVDAHNRATGDIVFHMDGDDVMYPGKLQSQYDVFLTDHTVNLTFHRACYFSDNGSLRLTTGPCPAVGNSDRKFSLQDLALWGTIAVHSSYAYRRNSRTTRAVNREFMEWFWAIDSLKNGGTGIYINKVLGGYRYNPNGSSYLSSNAGRKKAYLLYLQDVYIYFRQLNHLKTALYANAFVSIFGMILNGKHLSTKALAFLLKNILCFRINLIIEAYKMRAAVRPSERSLA